MVETTSSSNIGGAVNRRTLVKGAAWAVPAVTVGAAAPAMAASPDPGLNGWVVISRWRDCDDWWGQDCTCYVRYDGYFDGDSSYDGVRLGLWVWDAHSSEITEAPSLTIHLPYTIDSWTPQNGNSGWSVPTLIGQDSEGFNMYRTTYSGAYVDQTGSDGLPEIVLLGRPHFLGRRDGSCPTNRRQKITRRVGINGETLQFTREVSFPSSFNLQMEEQDAPQREQSLDEAAETAAPEGAEEAMVPEVENQQVPAPVDESAVPVALS